MAHNLKDAATDLATHIVSSVGGGTWTKGTNLFVGRLRPVGGRVPQEAVFVEEVSEEQPDVYIAGGAKVGTLHRVRLVVVVRGDRLKDDATRTKAKAINAAIHATSPSGYVDCVCLSTIPFEMPKGVDANESPIFMTDVVMIYEES